MTSINHSAAMSDGVANPLNGADARKPWTTPQVIVSVMQNSENNNNSNNSDSTTQGIPVGNS